MILSPPAKSSRPLALVTGASSGLGADLARELARDSPDLVLVARREAPMQALAAELACHRVSVTVVPTNLGVIDSPSRLAANLERCGLGCIDVLVNNAGFGDYANFVCAEPTKLSEMVQLNVAALTELTRVFLPGMVARGVGKVLLVGATAGFVPGPGAAVYHATKAYVLSLGQALEYELRGSGVTVTTVCPGPTQTGFCTAANRRLAASHRGCKGMMASAIVARRAYAALKEERRLAVPGLGNKLRAAWLRVAPHALLLAAGVI